MTCIFCAEPKIQFPRYEENAERGGKNNKNDVDVALLSLSLARSSNFLYLYEQHRLLLGGKGRHTTANIFRLFVIKIKEKLLTNFIFFAAASSASCGTRQWAEFRDISMGIMLCERRKT